jgi:glutamate racemase
MDDRPIGLFDSGFGGLTVMKEAARLLPKENLLYFADTANLPYGEKSPESIIELALENVRFLTQKGAKLLIVACHTACLHAFNILKNRSPIPVFGMIDASLHLVKPFEKVAVLGTKSSIESGIYQSLIRKQNPNVKLHAVSCPLFVPLIEDGLHDSPEAERIAEKYLALLKGNVDAVLLACTHYGLMKPVLQKVFGNDVKIFDPAEECVLRVKDFLQKMNLLNRQSQNPQHSFYVSGDLSKFQKLASFFSGNLERK